MIFTMRLTIKKIKKKKKKKKNHAKMILPTSP